MENNNNINENILSWNIISVPSSEFGENHPLYESWMKKKKTQDENEGMEAFYKSAGFYAEYSKILCISACYLHKGKIRCTLFTGEEKDVIDKFILACESFIALKGSIVSAGHNIMQHSVPYLRKRYGHYYPMFDFPKYLSDLGEKPWTISSKVWDIMTINAGVGESYASLEELAYINNVTYPQNLMRGQDLHLNYRHEESVDIIYEYSNQRALITLQIIHKWFGLESKEVVNVIKLVEEDKQLLPLEKKAKGLKISDTEEQSIYERTTSLEAEEKPWAELILNTVGKINSNF